MLIGVTDFVQQYMALLPSPWYQLFYVGILSKDPKWQGVAGQIEVAVPGSELSSEICIWPESLKACLRL